MTFMDDDDRILDYDEDMPSAVPAVNLMEIDGQEKTREPYNGESHLSHFRDMMLRPELLRAIHDAGLEYPSEVQHECIPPAVLGSDILCQAKSGMGKTAVFVIATLQQLQPVDGEIQVLVMCHTRELAFQISKEFERFGKHVPKLRVAVFFGGVSRRRDEDVLRNTTPHVAVGTPGRLLDLITSQRMDLRKLKFFIVDECDKMLEEAMRIDVIRIFKQTPRDKQVMMFSATLPSEIRTLCKKFMRNPTEVYVDDEAKLRLTNMQQYYISLKEHGKNKQLLKLLDELEFNQVVIFVRTVERCNMLCRLLQEENFPTIQIHRQMQQSERIERYQLFRDFHKRILIATNLFGRGIDISHVNVVINYDMAEDTDTYLHRIGRAGRFETKGLAITFIAEKTEAETLNRVQDRLDVTVEPMPAKIDPSSYVEK